MFSVTFQGFMVLQRILAEYVCFSAMHDMSGYRCCPPDLCYEDDSSASFGPSLGKKTPLQAVSEIK